MILLYNYDSKLQFEMPLGIFVMLTQIVFDIGLLVFKGKYDEMKMLPIRFALIILTLLTPHFTDNPCVNPVYSELASSFSILFVVQYPYCKL